MAQTHLSKILMNERNNLVFSFFEIPIKKPDTLQLNSINDNNEWRHSEGLNDFFSYYAKYIPDNHKFLFNGLGLLLNPENGELYAVQFGRFNVAFKCDLKRNQLNDSDELRVHYNLDGIDADIRPLGNGWALAIKFVGDLEQQLMWSYEMNTY